MIDDEFLSILVCPETKQSLHRADEELLARVNADIEKGCLLNKGGDLVREVVEDVLVREDGRFGYLVKGGIPIMLVEESIPLE